MKWEKFEVNIKCKKCDGVGEIILHDDGGCSDPECCGGASYNIAIECENCKEEEENY